MDLPETNTQSWRQAQNHTQLSFETAKKKIKVVPVCLLKSIFRLYSGVRKTENLHK